MRFVIVTGMSGAGKITALKIFEDNGYYCVDNLPIDLIENFADLLFTQTSEKNKVAMGVDIRSGEQLDKIKNICLKINELLTELFDQMGITLVDFKLEFGLDGNGKLMLADEISPDTCRFWDNETNMKLDKDRFRKDLGDVLGAYNEIWNRLQKHFNI